MVDYQQDREITIFMICFELYSTHVSNHKKGAYLSGKSLSLYSSAWASALLIAAGTDFRKNVADNHPQAE
jgi:hypothetical protein